jgi:hypothetical protein
MSGFGLFPDTNRKWSPDPAAQQELELVRRALDRRTKSIATASQPGGVVGPLVSVGVGTLALAAFVAWLLLGPPLPR